MRGWRRAERLRVMAVPALLHTEEKFLVLYVVPEFEFQFIASFRPPVPLAPGFPLMNPATAVGLFAVTRV